MKTLNKRSRRTPEQQIADLQAKIAAIQERKERKKALKDPALRHIAAAMRSVKKALDEATVPAMKQSLAEARGQLAACVGASGAGNGAVLIPRRAGPGRPRKSPTFSNADSDAVLRYVRNHPGARCEDVAGALGAESSAISPVLKALNSEGKVEREGKARGTKYYVTK